MAEPPDVDPHDPLGETLDQARGAQSGDPEAWAALERRCRAWMRRRLDRVRLPSGVELDDVLQMVLQDVFVGFGRFQVEPGARFWAWLACILDHTLTDLRRRVLAKKRGEGREILMRDWFDSTVSDPGIPSHELGQVAFARYRELERHYRDALRQLPPSHAAVLELRDLEGFDYARICDAVGAPTAGAVRLTCHRARARMRELMAPFVDEA